MIPIEYKSFINDIIARTESRTAKWKVLRTNTFILTIKTSSIEVGHFVDEDRERSIYTFRYRNIANKVETGFNVNSLEEDWDVMDHLFTVASASANNVSSELSNFLDGLNE
jgi:hypothetical protein